MALALGALLTLLLSHVSASVAPLRLLAVAGVAFAAWCFCDEMGLRKPLNRAGLVLFAMAMAARVQRILGLWGYLAAWLLWRGHVRRPSDPPQPRTQGKERRVRPWPTGAGYFWIVQ